MNKKLALFSILIVVLLAGCSIVPQFQQAREDYLETRVVEILEEMPTTEPSAVEPTTEVTEIAATDEPTAEPTAEVTAEVTEEVTEEPTEVVTEEATAAATEEVVESYDPQVYLGDSDWEDDMTEVGNWPLGTDLSSATYDNETLSITTLSDKFSWRIASTGSLGDAYIEASIKVGECSGADSYGIIFRVPENTGYNRGYLFGINCKGEYMLRSWDGLTGASGVMTYLQSPTESSMINAGSKQTNRLGVMALKIFVIM